MFLNGKFEGKWYKYRSIIIMGFLQGGLVYQKQKKHQFLWANYSLKLLSFGNSCTTFSNLPQIRPVQDFAQPTGLSIWSVTQPPVPNGHLTILIISSLPIPPVQSNPSRRVTPAGWNPSRQRYPQKGWWFWSLWTRHLVASYTSGTCSRGSQNVI